MCKCLWGTSAKITGVCFFLGIDTFTVVHVDEIRKNRSYTRLDSQIANVYGKWENGKIWKNSKSCRQDLETLHLASKIWKILNLVGKICKILNLVGKICKKFKNVPARFGKFKNLPATFGEFKILLARLGKFKILPARSGIFNIW